MPSDRLAAICTEDAILQLFEDYPDENLATNVFVWLVTNFYEANEDCTSD